MINLSFSAVVAILYQLVWPWIASILLLLLIGTWRFRSQHPNLYAVLVAIEIVGSIPAGFYWASAREKHLRWSQEVEYWESVSKAANSDNVPQALRLLATRSGGLRSYVERGVGDSNDGSNTILLREAFAQCVDLLDDQSNSMSILLVNAVSKGHPNIVKTWLDSAPCAGQTLREEGIASILNLLVPYTSSDMNAVNLQLRGRQAEALKLLIERYPDLANVPLRDLCGGKGYGDSKCPTLVEALLDKWHLEGVAAVLPLDAHASEHLPSVVLHVLRGEAMQAAVSAKADPGVFHKYLPSLLATAPQESLLAALRAAPPDEEVLLTPDDGESMLQHLWPLFEAAKRRDAGQPTWHFLRALFDLFPMRLRDVDTSLYSSYVIGAGKGNANLEQLMNKLQSAGLSCDGIQGLASWGDSFSRDDWQRYRQRAGCEPSSVSAFIERPTAKEVEGTL